MKVSVSELESFTCRPEGMSSLLKVFELEHREQVCPRLPASPRPGRGTGLARGSHRASMNLVRVPELAWCFVIISSGESMSGFKSLGNAPFRAPCCVPGSLLGLGNVVITVTKAL